MPEDFLTTTLDDEEEEVEKYQCLSCGYINEGGEDICEGCGGSRKELEKLLEEDN